ncbi:prepilin-type N-terminal cleavage/methylation domain-containing protein [Clostridium chrysemydis]|uniref:prepilin-type N-terminal cleavage/methylation domain-containing protein n=1 Tax=Clostridium chrysemydis TaxID=2665504 RepID=UPI001883EEB3|nr:prepilin-type N-terminal cleavage/methylation domain-containing protein [Clostridium chrysemydis]
MILKKNFGWKKSKGFTLIELIISISMISIVLVISTTLYLDSIKHKKYIEDLNLNECKINDIGIDIKNRLNSEMIESHEVSRKQIISKIKKTTSYDDFFVLSIKNNNLVQEKYTYKNGYQYLIGEIVIAKGINDITFYNKGKLIYAKADIKGVEEIIWL